MNTQGLISIISINYNSLDVTCEMIESVRRQDYKHVEVIVVDNASDENPESYIRERFPEVIFIRSEHNLGFSGGNNLGIQVASGDFLFFLNNDAELTDGCLESLHALFQRFPRAGIASPKICYYNAEPGSQPDVIQYAGTTHVHPLTARNSTFGQGAIDNGQFPVASTTAYAHGAAMMVPRKVIDRVGKMPEVFFLYYEELDWSEQIRRAGYEVYIEPNAKVYHKESYSVAKINALKTYYLNRNRILFVRRNRSLVQLAIFSVFFTLVTFPKNVLSYILKGEIAQLKSFLKAISWHFSTAENISPDSTPLTFKSIIPKLVDT